ncbi:MAG: TRAP transporter small permease [Ramlibacter sp.]|nr:TRAP transporter small permease [Ramlibacter sp.]
MRRLLNVLYDGSAWLAVLSMVALLVMVLLSILSRQLEFQFPGADAYAGYCMAAVGFLALAHTLKHNEHIRVTLILARLKGRARHRLELWALSAAVLLAGLMAFYSVRLALVSRTLHDISTGQDATPLWIPQLTMAVGAVILLVALIDEWVLELRGQRPSTDTLEAARHE